MATYKTPGVYIEEISSLPPSIAEVETAIPAFIGYTEKGTKLVAEKLTSLMDYQLKFGSAEPEKNVQVNIQDGDVTIKVDPAKKSKNILFYAMRLFFANGGGQCYVVSTGSFEDSKAAAIEAYDNALDIIAKEDEPTLLVFPDAPYHIPEKYYALMQTALAQCQKLGDRFLIMDVLNNNNDLKLSKEEFRKIGITREQAKYGAAYFPDLNTSISYMVDSETMVISGDIEPSGTQKEPAGVSKKEEGAAETPAPATGKGAPKPVTKTGLSKIPNDLQNRVKQKMNESGVQLTPCAAVAGIYARVDSTRGVWKAPANEAMTYVISSTMKITDEDQTGLNIDEMDGKSINAIRSFVGKGTKIWGARTLAGNDNEWRYINVRRFFNMVEESVKKSTAWAVFEPNDTNTWNKVRAMIENYLILKWKDGALAGAKPDNAFFVRVGLGQTMTSVDVLEGRMIVEIGLAAVRPAEFIILKFSHKLQTA